MTIVHPLPPGLIAVIGGERTGKTTLLRRLSGHLPSTPCQGPHADTQWLDLSLPGQDDQSPLKIWGALRESCPRWNAELHQDLNEALQLLPHMDKKLFMLSTGSRRKVALAGLLACGATVTCLDQPYAALDKSSIQVIREFLSDMSEHDTRTWVVADYEADPLLSWKQIVSLDASG